MNTGISSAAHSTTQSLLALQQQRESLRLRRIRQAKLQRLVMLSMQIGIVVLVLALWEWSARSQFINAFLFASPSMIWEVLVQRWNSGELVNDVRVTAGETLIGFVIGACGGALLGLLLWYSRFVAELTAPFIAAIGAIPVLAIAPVTIIWFGTGMLSKVMIVAFSCVVVSLSTAYQGARRTDPDLLNLMRSFNASRRAVFFKLVVPSAMAWVLSGLRLNAGFALVGAIVGEYISSEAGVGHMILLGSSNFTISLVLAGIFIIMVMTLLFLKAVKLLERVALSWEKEDCK